LKLEQEVTLLTAIGLVSNSVVGTVLVVVLLYYNAESANLRLLQVFEVNKFLIVGGFLIDLATLVRIIYARRRKYTLKRTDWLIFQVGAVFTLLISVWLLVMMFWLVLIQIFSLVIGLAMIVMRLVLVTLNNQGRITAYH
jgi:hypothetical protein